VSARRGGTVAAAATGPRTAAPQVCAAAPGRCRTAPASAGAGVEIAPGTPAEHGLREEFLQAALEMAELFGGVAAVAARRQMLLDIREQRHTKSPPPPDAQGVPKFLSGSSHTGTPAWAARSPPLFERLQGPGHRHGGKHLADRHLVCAHATNVTHE
jgi:hypothetical protein